MEHVVQQERNALESAGRMIGGYKGHTRLWSAVGIGMASWDIRLVRKSLDQLRADSGMECPAQTEAVACVNEWLPAIESYLGTPEYAAELTEVLQGLFPQLGGSFPAYELLPFELAVEAQEGMARLKLGRKAEALTVLRPSVLGRMVKERYDRLIARKVDVAGVAKDLLEAYRVFTGVGGREPTWGSPVDLLDIYKLLTLRHGTGKEYSKEMFTYELSVLSRQQEIVSGAYRLSLGYTRDGAKALILLDETGQQRRVRTLQVYPNQESRA